MEVGQGPNWGCSAKEKKTAPLHISLSLLIANSHIFRHYVGPIRAADVVFK
jgi:hypothetical protein